MALLLLASLALMCGCTAGAMSPDLLQESGVVSPVGNNTEALSPARTFFYNRAQPILEQRCKSCHLGQGANGPPWYQQDINDTSTNGIAGSMLTWYSSQNQEPLIRFNASPRSLLLTKGQHDGPAFHEEQKEALIEWMSLEKQEGAVEASAPFPDNATDTLAIATGNASLSLVAQGQETSSGAMSMGVVLDGNVWQVRSIRIYAPEGRGLCFDHPRIHFVSNGVASPDTDRFQAASACLEAGESFELGDAHLIALPQDATIIFAFDHLESIPVSGNADNPKHEQGQDS